MLAALVVSTTTLCWSAEPRGRESSTNEWSLGEVAAGQVVTGPGNPSYHLVLPGGWTLQTKSQRLFDTLATSGELSVRVSPGGKATTNMDLVEDLRAALKKTAVSCEFGALSEVQIDGRAWLQCSAQIEHREVPGWFTYQYYLYADAEGSFVIAGWRRGPFKGSELAIIRDVALTFQFPAKATPRPRRAPPVPTPTPMPVTSSR